MLVSGRTSTNKRHRAIRLTRRSSLSLSILILLSAVTFPQRVHAVEVAATATWPMGCQNLADTRDQDAETTVGAENVGALTPSWVFTTGGNVSATPPVVDGSVYGPDWAGTMYKIDATTGITLWAHQISAYNGIPGSVSRTSPVVVGHYPIAGRV